MGNFALEYEKRRQEELKATKEILQEVCKVLTPLGITSIDAEYDGCGDSGAVENIAYYANGQEYKGDLPKDKFASLFNYSGQESHQIGLEEIIDEICCSLLPGGWEINEGSFGTFKIDINKKTVNLEHNQRYIEHETSEEVFEL